MRPRATISTMKQTDARITEVSRLAVLECERMEILAEINALRSMQSEGTAAIKVSGKAGDPIDRKSTIVKKVALFSRAFPRPLRCLSHPLRESYDGARRLRTCLWE
jgi:hypothetical protein